MEWKIYGTSFRDKEHKTRILCILDADSFDEAIEKARRHYGKLYVTGAQPV